MKLTQQELEAFYLEYESPLYNFALRWVWNRALAQDLVQDAFMRIWEKREDIDRSTLKSLLYKTVQNLAINEYRKMQIRKSVPLMDWFLVESPQMETSFLEQENLKELQAALDALPADIKKTLLLCEFSDMNYEQVASTLGIPAGTVASRRNRGIQLLQKLMNKERNENGKF